MARQIDESKPLSAADRRWLTDWGKHDVIARIDAAHGQSDDDGEAGDSAGVATDVERKYNDLIAQANDALAKHGLPASSNPIGDLEAALTAAESAAENGPLGVPAGFINEGDDDDVEDPGDIDYEELTNEELRDLLGGRQLSRSGNKEELIARLREDDEA